MPENPIAALVFGSGMKKPEESDAALNQPYNRA
jgi:hypothetical protein